MRKNAIIILCILLLFSIAANFYLWIKYQNDVKLLHNLCNSKSISLLYGLETNQTEKVKDILRSDLVQLIHDYDREQFEQSRALLDTCKYWNEVIRKPVLDMVKNIKDNDYAKTVEKNYIILDNECK